MFRNFLSCVSTTAFKFQLRRQVRLQQANFQLKLSEYSAFISRKPSSLYPVYSWNSSRFTRGSNGSVVPALILGLFGFLTPSEEEHENEKGSEAELITIIKRAVLMIQRDEFQSAEQLLHVALKLAQETQNADGVTYIYDLMANLAFAQGQYQKAEKLFKGVMSRLLSKGVTDDDLKISHMSLKLAKIYEEAKDYRKAEEGYKFCLNKLGSKVNSSPEDEDALLLWAMTLDWYARFLLDRNRMDEAMTNFNKAYDMSLKINGEIHEQTVVLLNDLGTISFLKGDYDHAIEYLQRAVDIGKHLPNMEDFSSIYVNLGNIYMQKQMYAEARKHCTEGMQNATRHKNSEGLEEAKLCLKELDKFFTQQ